MRLLTHIVPPQEDGLPVKHLLQRHFALSSTLLKSIKWRKSLRVATFLMVIADISALNYSVSNMQI